MANLRNARSVSLRLSRFLDALHRDDDPLVDLLCDARNALDDCLATPTPTPTPPVSPRVAADSSPDVAAFISTLADAAAKARADAVDLRARAEAIDEAPFSAALYKERERERVELLNLAEARDAEARAYSIQKQTVETAVALAANIVEVEESAMRAANATGSKAEDLADAAAVDESAATAVAQCIAELLPSLSNADRLDAVGGELALALGDDEARETAALILRAFANAVEPRA